MNETFCIEIPVNDPEKMEDFNAFMDAWQDEQVKYEEEEAKRLGISFGAACDILYLRTRSRHTQDMEDYLIYLDQNNLPSPQGICSGEWDYEKDIAAWKATKK